MLHGGSDCPGKFNLEQALRQVCQVENFNRLSTSCSIEVAIDLPVK